MRKQVEREKSYFSGEQSKEKDIDQSKEKDTDKKVGNTKKRISTVTIGGKEAEEEKTQKREIFCDYIESGSREAYELRKRVRTVIWDMQQKKLTCEVPTNFHYSIYWQNPLIEEKYIIEIEKIFHEMLTTDEFYYNKNQRYFYYCDAFLKTSRRRYWDSTESCINGISLENPLFHKDRVTASYYSLIGQSLLCLCADNYMEEEKYEDASLMYDYIIRSLECREFADMPNPWKLQPYELGLYQYAAYQIGRIFDMHGYFEEALAFVDRGIQYAYQGHYMHYLSKLVELRSYILRHANKNFESIEWEKFYWVLNRMEDLMIKDKK